MKLFTFYDHFQRVYVSFRAETVELAYIEMCNNFGTSYVFDNITLCEMSNI